MNVLLGVYEALYVACGDGPLAASGRHWPNQGREREGQRVTHPLFSHI